MQHIATQSGRIDRRDGALLPEDSLRAWSNGKPHLGQNRALVETWFSHSGQDLKLIVFSA
jgi:hypothetical protein